MRDEALYKLADTIYEGLLEIPSRIMKHKCGQAISKDTAVTKIYLILEADKLEATKYINRSHLRIDPQPVVLMRWEVHEKDDHGRWFKPRSGSIYPLFNPPEPGMIHVFCDEHQQWEWMYS